MGQCGSESRLGDCFRDGHRTGSFLRRKNRYRADGFLLPRQRKIRRSPAAEVHGGVPRRSGSYDKKIRLTILIGKYAADYYLSGQIGHNQTETVRHYQEYLLEYFPIVHPSPLNIGWQKKNPWFQEDVVPVL